ncbi:2Fe-2S iron-sulfur cluster-binding protein [Niveispirillum sp. BGYR6]|uniref:2Fe-2S iron-sulfur cluster-binding protein n=1 Tax=Niveispirillum sp. BGYR6 TaxID=2971249 RepID=UPI0022B9A814|nr:2Fe-2S iron-sulfur cluster-binding protein [Niveispirillum sp. BGYR6]MDG5496148.1 2Fe-2S iron-sulfur cluster-binding protein [Niveispirillum sp. BGYR6]
MTLIQVTDRDGTRHSLDAPDGDSLMVALRNGGLSVEGLCGGNMACGTCHIHVLNAREGQLPPVSADEAALLADLPDTMPQSRLACQIPVGPVLEGLSIVVAPDD